MNPCRVLSCLVLAVCLHVLPTTEAQLPPRINVPGAVFVNQPTKVQYRQQRVQLDASPQPRLRRPPPPLSAAPPPPQIRPVVEDVEEHGSQSLANFDDELSKLGISALQSAVRQAGPPQSDDEADTDRPAIQFRPERPLPVLRPDRPLPVLRQDIRESPREPPPTPLRSVPLFRDAIPAKPVLRQESVFARPQPSIQREELAVQQVRQPSRQAVARQNAAHAPAQPLRQPARALHPRPAPQYADDDGQHHRQKKPVVQILRKYRTDNEDGSITWGYENEDGTFKEETLGVDCITRGKYGYVDPDGVRREYSYETGNKCDEPEEEEPEQLLQARQPLLPQQQGRKPPQLRPLPAQY